jgi:hypothetical protein
MTDEKKPWWWVWSQGHVAIYEPAESPEKVAEMYAKQKNVFIGLPIHVVSDQGGELYEFTLGLLKS